MDDEVREAFRQLREDNKSAHDEIKESIRCLPCTTHADQLLKHSADIAVLRELPKKKSVELDWKVISMFGAIVLALVAIIKDMIAK